MHAEIFAPRYLVLAIFVLTGTYVQLRGRVRHRFLRAVTDHSTFMAPYNALMYAFSAVRATPYADLNRFQDLSPIHANWKLIREEALRLFDDGYIRAASGYNDLGFNSFFRHGWKRFYLKWYDDFLPSAKSLCPKTAELLAGIPSVNAAMFALLPPGARLGAHRDPFAGSLRYHLGLVTPNSEHCQIVVDGEPYHWKDGEAVMFDETFIHWAENKTDQTRLILLCDIERPLSNRVMRGVNRIIGRRMAKAAATQNVDGEPVGALNRAFQYVYQFRLFGKRLKARNEPAYHLGKWVLIGGLLFVLFFWR